MKFLTNITAAVGLLVLAACGTASDTDIGEGPIHLAPVIADLFEDYKKTFIPYYFLVTTDGYRGNYVYCENACLRHQSRQAAIINCEANSDGVPCAIFASGENIIWKGKVTGLYNPETGAYTLSHE